MHCIAYCSNNNLGGAIGIPGLGAAIDALTSPKGPLTEEEDENYEDDEDEVDHHDVTRRPPHQHSSERDNNQTTVYSPLTSSQGTYKTNTVHQI